MTVFSTNEPKPSKKTQCFSTRIVFQTLQRFCWFLIRSGVFPTNPKIWGDPLHLLHESSTKVLDVFQIVFHGEGEVHKIIQVDGVILSTLEFQLKRLGLALREKRIPHKTTRSTNFHNKQTKTHSGSPDNYQIGVSEWVSAAGSGWSPQVSASWAHPSCGWWRACLY